MVQFKIGTLLALAATAIQATQAAAVPESSLLCGVVSSLVELLPFYATVSVGLTAKATIGYSHVCAQPGCAEISKNYAIPLSLANGQTILNNDCQGLTNLITAEVANAKLTVNQLTVVVVSGVVFGVDEIGTLLNRLANGAVDAETVISQELSKLAYQAGQLVPQLAIFVDVLIALSIQI